MNNNAYSLGVTAALGLAVFIVLSVSQTIGMLWGVFEAFPEENFLSLFQSMDEAENFIQNGDVLARTAIVSGFFTSLFVLLLVKLKKGADLKSYFAFVKPNKKWINIGLIFIGFAIVVEVLSAYTTVFESSFMADASDTTTNVFYLFLGVGVLGPIFEELFFRGFLYTGISQKIGEDATIWSTSILFALMHLQYNWAIILMIIPIGLILGYARKMTGSIYVPILLHIINNCFSIYYELI